MSMSTLLMRDCFGDIYLLAPAYWRPDSMARFERMPQHVARWVLGRCTIDRGRLAVFFESVQSARVASFEPLSSAFDELDRMLADNGQLVLWREIDVRPQLQIVDRPATAPLLSDLAEPPVKEPDVWFEVAVVDEAGEPICGIDVSFSVTAAPTETRITDAAGRARLYTQGGSVGTIAFVSPADVRDEVQPRWQIPRSLASFTDPVITRMTALQLSGKVAIESKVPHLIVVEPPPIPLARLRGLLFDTNKTFLLPTAIKAMKDVRRIWQDLDPVDLVVVGHTDTTGEPDVNDPLSQARADSLRAYLLDDVDAWLANYSAPPKKQWGRREDRLMISRMPGLAAREPQEDLVRWFQRTRGLTIDGKAGPKTRMALVTEYMALDGPALGEQELHVSIATLGCGERHPLAEGGERLDAQPADDTADALDRRAELFFFDAALGVLPPPSSPDGPEYLQWRARAQIVHDVLIEGMGNEVEILELHDALFRLDSAVVLPEGENPGDEHTSLTSVGLFATLLRFNEEHPGRRLLIAGHTDTSGGEGHNQALSEERARCALALTVGDRGAFVAIVKARHKVADYKQILSWCTAAFGDRAIGDGGFDCAPDAIDNVAFTAIEPIKRFQAQYNANREAIGAADQPTLAVDGAMGPKTWGAFFDVYQFGIAEELDEDAAGVAALREQLVFVREGDEALGFGEHHPIDQPHRDSLRSQTNRRVEILLFDSTTDFDIDLAKSDPDITELYLPGAFRRIPVEPMVSAKRWRAQWDKPLEPAQHLRGRPMILDAPGLPEGTSFSFEIRATIDDGEPTVIATVTGVSEEGRCTASFDGWAAAVTVTDPERKLGEELPRVEFAFTVTGGGRTIESPNLPYADTLDVTFVHAKTGEPCVATHWFVLTSWGFLEGITGDDGRVAVTGLPPGGARATLAHVNAVEQSNG